MTNNIHASAICVMGQGVLFLGDSGSGKSDMSLRMIAQYGAKLISDDRVDIKNVNNCLIASAPKSIQGLLEVRGVGIVDVPTIDQSEINIVVQLVTSNIDRMPEKATYEIEGITLPFIKINPFEASSTAKILAALRLL